jgi:hypothetical protein
MAVPNINPHDLHHNNTAHTLAANTRTILTYNSLTVY